LILVKQADHGVVHQTGLLELPAGIEQGLPRNSNELRPTMCPTVNPIGEEPGSRWRAGDDDADHRVLLKGRTLGQRRPAMRYF
jgi:hypothetical protein